MTNRPKKIVLHSLGGYRPELDALIADWMQRGVTYVGVVGVDASHIEDMIDEMAVGDGSSVYDVLIENLRRWTTRRNSQLS